MRLALAAIMRHQYFDWSCRKNKSALVKNMEMVVKEITGLAKVDINPSSPLFKAATKCYNLVKKKKNVRLGKEVFLKNEQKTLEMHEVQLEEEEFEEEVEEEEVEEEAVEEEEVEEGVKEKKTRRKKSYSDLKSEKVKKARVENVVEMKINDFLFIGGQERQHS